MKGVMLSSMGWLFQDAVGALQSEEDLTLAEYSLASDIKLLDALLRSKPTDRVLSTLVVQGRCSFAMAFVEEEEPDRAVTLYHRAMRDGLRALEHVPGLIDSIDARNEDTFVESLSRVRRRDMPLFFWTVSAWAAWVNGSRDNPEATSQVVLVERAIGFLLNRDETFFFAGPHLMAGVFYSSRPTLLGGDPQKGRHHFERCIELSQGCNLMARVLLAEYYAVQMQDRGLFEEALADLEKSGATCPEELILMNQVARRRGARLFLEAEDLFF